MAGPGGWRGARWKFGRSRTLAATPRGRRFSGVTCTAPRCVGVLAITGGRRGAATTGNRPPPLRGGRVGVGIAACVSRALRGGNGRSMGAAAAGGTRAKVGW